MGLPRTAAGLVVRSLRAARVLTAARLVRPYSPRVVLGVSRTLRSWGVGPAAGCIALAQRAPTRVGLVDERGELTFLAMHQRSNALADSLRRRGLRAGDTVAVMMRNHRGFLDVTLATSKLGADLLFLNTAFAAPALRALLERERPALVVHDEEFSALLDAAGEVDRVLGWTDTETWVGTWADGEGPDTVESLVAAGSSADLEPPGRASRLVILTSGTTGAPRGAARSDAGVDAAVALLSRLPLRAGGRTHIAAPLFHTWGLAHWALCLLLGSTVVLRRRFEPEDCVRAAELESCDALVVVPVMLQRILELDDDVLAGYDLSRVRVVAVSGSALPGDLPVTWMDRFGDTLFNVYGSAEVAYATVAGPADLRSVPGTAGRPPYSTVVRILDAAGDPVPTGESGRIFVGNSLLLAGYTGGGGKEVLDGLMASGDVGRLDADGLLYVEGRDDEMIVSGGENVFPQEVEDCLARHKAVREAAAVGVVDDDFGQRLRAFVVLRDPAPGPAVDERTLQAHVRDHLARFAVPREIVFLDALPRNAPGKVLKRELAART